MNKSFLSRLIGVSEADIVGLEGMTFALANATEEMASFKGLLTSRVKTKVQALTQALITEDDLGKVIRAHIHIEHELYDLIFFAAPCPEQLLKSKDMEFSEKVRLALVLGLNAELKPALTAVSKLRNNFAHRIDMRLEEKAATQLVDLLPRRVSDRFKKILKEALSELTVRALKGEGLSYFRTQTQILVFFLGLFDAVAEERHRLAFEKLETMAWH
ncbi:MULTISPECIES: hypothetical protein [unclassified Bradyrhizobium]|uniref:hypothetical protein n=1 Tax=unclassified Bradyrhizobium TaxID=2631580 RepID=UPI001BAB7866|nr:MULTISPECIES: hypothetical protein [unclassified Bradyrhizobium]MBR1204512.1 hypothetical protein [Bradyrhizobium sp. AUGA SZCCT0124]MBR1309602.1 hypothetical protein [Bradyrhizobium sp. AUGA SZCCT0051]MBR1339743.1 hypothetical protein [Bradyrhizobium sp. AUGA SZCCT0105]MBR1354350.1 hypothetical protein [Bradyrhizobium sp. AUGA SZCCT0045]